MGNVQKAHLISMLTPKVYADLILKQASLDMIKGDDTGALSALDAALHMEQESADDCLGRNRIYSTEGILPLP